jgi:hypothetical protein
MKTKLFQILGVVAIGLFSFSSCETDACKDVTCENGGICVDGDCDCPAGFGGLNCGTAWAAAFTGTFNGVDNCEFVYESTITSSAPTSLSIGNIFGLAASGTATISSATTISIAAQTVNSYDIQGTGTLNGNVLTIEYVIDGDACTVVYTKAG